MYCKKVRSKLNTMLDTGRQPDSVIKTHLQSCDSCSQYYRQLLNIHRDLTLEQPDRTTNNNTGSVKMGVLNALDKNEGSTHKIRSANLNIHHHIKKAALATVAACIAAIILVNSSLITNDNANIPRPPAAQDTTSLDRVLSAGAINNFALSQVANLLSHPEKSIQNNFRTTAQTFVKEVGSITTQLSTVHQTPSDQ
ncbi:hypothetical protein STSP2_01647 [Anaerohalosphaera lusitana]|uniref:Zinc-finger domain-containing protein n=1 Tax=Anaerohalosphaera lusitana TaxID=1936003 RepID=A0A1U9NKM1_9BACT|nr:hypothetical protein [Anaerohalosphaera lusitana]AQT68483.1 hypothetical protein STSP2_01647 [Anaerohalosphaera lusitana]